MKEPQTVALKLMVLVLIGTFATALNLSISLQEAISIAWWGEARAPHFWFGWSTLALEATVLSMIALWGGYRAGARSGPLAINAMIIVSVALAIFGLVVYSRMAPVSEIRLPADLRSRAFQNFLALFPELLAQLIAQMGVGAIAGRFFATDDPRTKGERPTAGP